MAAAIASKKSWLEVVSATASRDRSFSEKPLAEGLRSRSWSEIVCSPPPLRVLTPAKPHVVVFLCTPKSDHNSLFSPAEMEPFYRQIRLVTRVTVCVIRNESDLKTHLETSVKRADCLILAGHGTNEYIKFSESYRLDSARPLAGILKTSCRKVVLLSCSTGFNRYTSIASRIARLGVDVLAPRNCSDTVNTEPNPVYLTVRGSFPINFTEGVYFSRYGAVIKHTGYEDISPKDFAQITWGIKARKRAFRAHRLFAARKIDLAITVLSSAIRLAGIGERKYVRNKALRITRALSSLGLKTESAKLLDLCRRYRLTSTYL